MLFVFSNTAFAQITEFSRQDTLTGTITPEREWWDLTYYHLSIKLNPDDCSFVVTDRLQYQIQESKNMMQIDLQLPKRITQITQNGKAKIYKIGSDWSWIILCRL